MNYKELDYLKKAYSERKDIIKNRLNYFKKVLDEDERRIFSELCFCLLTPQSKAKICDAAIRNLVKTELLFSGNERDIKEHLIGVRFNNNKAKYVVQAREKFNGNLKKMLTGFDDNKKLREWLVKNVKGIGLKEGAHFLRNIGMYEDIAILDRHILKNLCRHNVIDEVPKSLNRKKYMEIENKMREFSDYINVPMEELDLLFWSEETGEVFK